MDVSNSNNITHSDQLQRKMHLTGKVIKTSTAGAIIDIGVEKPALLHVSQISTKDDLPLKRVEDVLTIDQVIDVWVRLIRNDRIEVTMKEPLKLEWREIQKDMVVTGKVVEIEKFGAFVDFGAERPGLLHISELANEYVKSTSDIVKVGDEVEVKILDFNRRKKQIKLSRKALLPEKEEKVEPIKQEVPKEKQENRKKKSKKSKEETQEETIISEPEPTVMELAWKEAKEKAGIKKQESPKIKKENSKIPEQEDILARTLDNRRK